MGVIYGIMGMGGMQGGQPIPAQFAAGLAAVWILLFIKKNKSRVKI